MAFKEVHTEIVDMNEEDCSVKTQDKVCTYTPGCKLADNDQICIKDKVPTTISLKETTCDKCVEGRTKIRPIVTVQEVCRQKTEQFCINMTDTLSNWKKWCKPNNNIPRINEIEGRDKTTEPTTTVAAAIKIELSPGIYITKILKGYLIGTISANEKQ